MLVNLPTFVFGKEMYVHHRSEAWGKIFLFEINTFIQQGCITLINRDSKYCYYVTKCLH